MKVEGRWHPKGSAAFLPARLISPKQGYFELSIDGKLGYCGDLVNLNVSDRLGNVERKITLEDGSLFTSKDNDSIDLLFKKHHKYTATIHILESKLKWVFAAVIITMLTTFIFFKWGIPWGSSRIAHSLPHVTNKLISSHTIEFLDRYMFDVSKISKEKQEQIRQHFHTKLLPLAPSEDQIGYKIHFRLWGDGNSSIPNALALPSGDIILTDKFVELAHSQDEIDAVLLHEMGHVVHRHGLKMIIESTFISVAVMLLVGDSNGLADMGVGLGSLMLSSSYSRGHESEADKYAFNQMLQVGIDPIVFSKIMNRMTEYMEGVDRNKTKRKDEDDILDYVSSHPSTRERVETAETYSKCFKKGLKKCEINGELQ